MVEGEDIPPPADRPLVGGDELRAVEELDGLGTEEDGHLPPGESDRDRVAALANADPCLRVHPVLRAEPHIEGLSGERPQLGSLDGEVLADAHRAPEDVAVIVGHVTRIAELVQLREGVDPGHRDEAPSPEASHLAFHAALLVRALHTGDAEERVEAVVRAQRHEPLALGAVPSLQDLGDRRGQVVVPDELGETSEGLGGPDVTVEEGLLALMQVDAVEALPRRGSDASRTSSRRREGRGGRS